MNISKNRIYLCILFLFFFLTSFSAPRHKRNKELESDTLSTTNNWNDIQPEGKYSPNPTVDSLLTYAFKYLHKPYGSGCSGPNSFDCSGFTSFVYGHFGYKLERSSGDQTKNGMEVSQHNLQPGDLVFYKGRSSRASRIGHVGIIVSVNENGSFTFIHSACGTGVSHDNSDGNYYTNRYVTACRVIDPQGLIAKKKLEKRKEEIAEFEEELPETKTVETTKTESFKVGKGQTLYSISKQYGCTLSQIREWNNLKSDKLKVGQQIHINSNTESSENVEEKNSSKEIEAKSTKKGNFTHTVKGGENLFSLAKKYNCTVDNIRDWNDLSTDNIQAKQKLIIGGAIYHKVKSGETLGDIAEKYDCNIKQLKQKNGLKTSRINVGQKILIK